VAPLAPLLRPRRIEALFVCLLVLFVCFLMFVGVWVFVCFAVCQLRVDATSIVLNAPDAK
jgi:hypothetical protein